MQIKTYEPGYDKKEFYGHMGDVLTMPEIKKELPYLRNSTEMVWFLAFNNDELIGFTAVEIGGKSVALRNQYVFPEHRKNGVFKKLLKKSLDYANKLNLPILVATSNDKKVVSMYQKLGFEEMRRTKNYVFLRKEMKDEAVLK